MLISNGICEYAIQVDIMANFCSSTGSTEATHSESGICLRQATNADFANRLYAAPEVTKSPRFVKPKLDPTGFTIQHYAGGVQVSLSCLCKRRKIVHNKCTRHQGLHRVLRLALSTPCART